MIDIHTLCEFSRNHCIAICAFLVPANLLATLQTTIVVALHRPSWQVAHAAGFASILAIALFFHVWSWLAIGVIMAPTYILFFLGSVCLLINVWAVASGKSMSRFLRFPYVVWRCKCNREPLAG